jgi:hypothetical protein
MRRYGVPAAFLVLGVIWTWFGDLYDLRWPAARILVSTFSALSSFILMESSLRLAAKEGRDRRATAILAVLPWNGVYLSQLPYLGFFFIPIEIVVSAIILRKRAPVRIPYAFVIAMAVRCIAAVLLFVVIYGVRLGWMAWLK